MLKREKRKEREDFCSWITSNKKENPYAEDHVAVERSVLVRKSDHFRQHFVKDNPGPSQVRLIWISRPRWRRGRRWRHRVEEPERIRLNDAAPGCILLQQSCRIVFSPYPSKKREESWAERRRGCLQRLSDTWIPVSMRGRCRQAISLVCSLTFPLILSNIFY